MRRDHDSTAQCSAVQCSAVQCSAVQCSAAQYSTVQPRSRQGITEHLSFSHLLSSPLSVSQYRHLDTYMNSNEVLHSLLPSVFPPLSSSPTLSAISSFPLPSPPPHVLPRTVGVSELFFHRPADRLVLVLSQRPATRSSRNAATVSAYVRSYVRTAANPSKRRRI